MPDPHRSHIEISGFTARFYDLILNLVTLGRYRRLMNRVLGYLPVKDGIVMADFGAGPGRNARDIIDKHPGIKKIFLVDIGREMLEQSEKKFRGEDKAQVLKQSILEPFELPEKADLVFMSFVLHGFEPHEQESIIQNVEQNLTDKGTLALFDWAEFDLRQSPGYLRYAFRRFECPIAQDFIRVNWKDWFEKHGFALQGEKLFFKGHFRLMLLQKTERTKNEI